MFRIRYKLVLVESQADKAAGQVSKDESKAFETQIQGLEKKLEVGKSDSELLAGQTKASINELGEQLFKSTSGKVPIY